MGFKARSAVLPPPAPRPTDRINEIVAALRRWNGNVSGAARELGLSRVHVHRLISAADVDVAALRNHAATAVGAKLESLKIARERFERGHIKRVLALCGGRSLEAAEVLGISRSLVKKRAGMTEPPPRPAHRRPPLPTRSLAPPKEEFEQLLVAHQGNVSAIARELGKARAQIHRWARRHGLRPADYR